MTDILQSAAIVSAGLTLIFISLRVRRLERHARRQAETINRLGEAAHTHERASTREEEA